MKLILKKTVFYTLIALIAFTLVASTGNSRQLLSRNDQQLQDCLMAGSVVKNRQISRFCTNFPKSDIAPNSNLNLSESERFLAEVKNKLLTLPQSGSYEYILLRAYGAIFVNQNPEVKLPEKVFFNNESETKAFQATLTLGKVKNTNKCYLQKVAADAFNRAKAQVEIPLKSGYGAGDCARTFGTNLKFWRKYANNITLDRIRQGKETKILSTVAPPGASQHLWGLAIDLRVSTLIQKQALYQNGWFQTVENDIPHWTYLGQPEEKLAELGLQNKIVRGVSYWVTPL
ncbi:D-alanyl-D-alanine carboxypeptidase family protein [Chlorogloeopsis sp. ULAP01]|uniref:D-alanyl-D-alanine carboxypeptidase family protein n=1 Tax=Chlorogloeopsis sp. ULAP01 TaxID=3056483 RepID=UPI0025AB39CA|nr:D-alanyl-D-alanine carboxypeptidase family protein [Chlorogloeopsis sp. ULAP01]MDM9381646.1 D-alanyl-D-alanine carboxypeptidase family protein [Chlorogloeopsis sp. ULAP01]